MQAELAPHPPRAMPHANIRAVLARPGFRRLLLVRLLSQLGDGWLQAGLAGSVFFNPEKAATPAGIAIAFAVLLVPFSTVGPFAGVFLDRWSRRNTLVVANALRAALAIPIAMYVWYGQESAAFVAVALAIIALNRFFLSGLSASQPHVVDEERLVTANSFSTTAGTVVYTTGLGSAAVLFQFAGADLHPYGASCASAVVAYGLSAALILTFFGAADLGPDRAGRVNRTIAGALAHTVRGMVSGLHHLAQRPQAWAALAVQAGNRGCYGALALTTLLLYRNYYNITADPAAALSGLAPVAGAAAAGSLTAALITPPLARRIGGWQWIVLMLGAAAVVVPALALPFAAALTASAGFAVSLLTQGTKIVTDTVIQLQVTDDYRGRVFSLSDTASNLSFVAGLFIGALTLPADGHSSGMIVAIAAGYAILGAGYAAVNTRRRPLSPIMTWRS